VGVRIFSSAAGAAAAAARELLDAAAASVAARGHFAVALSGGSALDALAPLLVAAKGSGADFSRWVFSFADDRVAPRSSPDSTLGAASAALFSKLGIDEAAAVVGLQEGLPADKAAAALYGALLALPRAALPVNAAGLPVFDAVVLGVGPDGHVASLFPNAPTLGATAASPWAVPVLASPKPPAARVTLTLPAINAAARVLLLATGPGKAAAVARALETQALPGACPAQLVRPGDGEATWFLDGDSAALLSVAAWGDSKKFPRSA
jgi:6-phosphogluconolactonase